VSWWKHGEYITGEEQPPDRVLRRHADNPRTAPKLTWIKVKNPTYTQAEGRGELLFRRRRAERSPRQHRPQALLESSASPGRLYTFRPPISLTAQLHFMSDVRRFHLMLIVVISPRIGSPLFVIPLMSNELACLLYREERAQAQACRWSSMSTACHLPQPNCQEVVVNPRIALPPPKLMVDREESGLR
jgi:hypothetical protein